MSTKQGFIRPYNDMVAVVQRVFDSVLIGATHYATVAALRPGTWSFSDEVASVLAMVVFYVIAEMSSLYRTWRAANVWREAVRVWQAWGLTVMAVLFVAFAAKVTSSYSRLASVTWFAVAPTALCLVRFAVRTALRRARANGRNTRTVAIAGATRVGHALARRVLGSPSSGMRIVGYYDDRAGRMHPMPEELGALSGGLDDLVELARRGGVDVVYVALPLRAESRIQDLVERLADTTASVYVVADFFVFDLLHAQWSDVQGIPVVSIFESPFFGIDGWLKRLQDLVLGTLIVGIISVPMLVIAAAIKLTSRGPVFFKQRRYGLNGQEIRVLKFRSMTVTEDGDRVVQASKGDSRVTPLGALLRRTSLDELPQFLQVLTGEMSIVGPRPHAVAHNEQYRRLIHGYMLRHKVKPGITGWAQINGWRGETDTLEKMEKRVEFDLEYIQNWSLGLDLRIIARTILSGFAARNAV
jgi:putative colanic acid biosynthesis UDP-glucose lipid carrier transferase